MTVIHAQRGHARLAPSSAHRWLVCSGSVSKSEHVPNRSTIFTREGTSAHELAECVMVTGDDPQKYLDGVINIAPAEGEPMIRLAARDNPEPDKENVWSIDEEMVESVELYRDTLLPLIEADDFVEWECKLDMRHIDPDCWGTGDCIIYKRRTRHLIVADFKYGSGVAVDAEDNEQLLTYGCGALKRIRDLGFEVDTVELIIIQPRAYHVHGPVRRQSIDVVDLIMFEDVLRAGAARTRDEDAELIAGHHCKFCPIAYDCDALRAHVLDAIGARFRQKPTEAGLPEIEKMTPAQLAKVLKEVQVIEGWLRRVMEYAHEQAVSGKIPPGFKLVEKRAYRKFKNVGDVVDLLEVLSYDESEYMTEPKLMTVAQVEKSFGKKAFANLLGDYVTKKSFGVVLAPADDHREAVKLDKSDAFGAVDEED